VATLGGDRRIQTAAGAPPFNLAGVYLMSQPANRRRFIQTTAGTSIGGWIAAGVSGQAEAPQEAGSNAIPEADGVAKKIWIDSSIAAWPPGPWRKVHIEYHTSRHMPRLAERFSADEFGDRLLAAHVDGATVFAKDMYGYSYFPSAHGRMHPNLSFDLLGAQVAALRKRKISVLSYYMLTWNPELAERHPEWLIVQKPGDKSRPKLQEISEEQKAFMNTLKPEGPRRSKADSRSKPTQPPEEDKGYRPYLWQFCICQEAFLKGELDLIQELVCKNELDAYGSTVVALRHATATNVCGSCAKAAATRSMRACSMLTKKSFVSHFLSVFTRRSRKRALVVWCAPRTKVRFTVSPSARRLSIIPPKKRSSRMLSTMATTISRR
jgi:hypothetical protein